MRFELLHAAFDGAAMTAAIGLAAISDGRAWVRVAACAIFGLNAAALALAISHAP